MNKQIPFMKTRGGAIVVGVVMTIVFVGIIAKSFYVLTA